MYVFTVDVNSTRYVTMGFRVKPDADYMVRTGFCPSYFVDELLLRGEVRFLTEVFEGSGMSADEISVFLNSLGADLDSNDVFILNLDFVEFIGDVVSFEDF